MPDESAVTRSSHDTKDSMRLARALRLPEDTDPSKTMRLAAEVLENGGEIEMTEQRLWERTAKFYSRRLNTAESHTHHVANRSQ